MKSGSKAVAPPAASPDQALEKPPEKGALPENRPAEARNPGQFPSGTSGNPGGRPKGHAEFQRLARLKSEMALLKLQKIMLDTNGAAAVRAAEIILEHAWGKPRQRTELSGPDGQPLNGPTVTLFELPANGRDIPAPAPPGDEAGDGEDDPPR